MLPNTRTHTHTIRIIQWRARYVDHYLILRKVLEIFWHNSIRYVWLTGILIRCLWIFHNCLLGKGTLGNWCSNYISNSVFKACTIHLMTLRFTYLIYQIRRIIKMIFIVFSISNNHGCTCVFIYKHMYIHSNL